MKQKVVFQEITFHVSPGPSPSTKILKTETITQTSKKSVTVRRILKHLLKGVNSDTAAATHLTKR